MVPGLSCRLVKMDAIRRNFIHENGVRRERNFRLRIDPFDFYTSQELYERFRFTENGIAFLLDFIENGITPNTKRNFAIPAKLKLLLTLRFLATGTFQLNVADHFGISQPSVSRSVWEVINALCNIAPRFIRYPKNDAEKGPIIRDLFAVAGIPLVTGLIDCTHIRIQSPSKYEHNEDAYVNRKGYHSMNIQCTVDSNYKFTSVLAKYPGSKHDSGILQESSLFDAHQSGRIKGMLLGDSGYACRSWLLTPYPNPQPNSPEFRFNQ